MDFERLEEFETVARLGSIRLAAGELGISAATLSARLLKFEEHLGAPLFRRTGKGLVLTAAGESLLPDALEILSSWRQLRREIHAARAHDYRRLRIAITGSSLPLHLGPFLDRLNLNHPGIRLEILDDSRYGIVDGLQSGEVDIYFAPVMADFAPQTLVKTPIASAAQYAILPKSHPLADRAMISIRELDREQFVLYPKTAESAIRDFQLRNLQGSGIHYFLYDSGTAVVFNKLLVPIGKGILLRPTHMMDLPPNTVCIPLSDLPYPAQICYFYSRSNPNPDIPAFIRDYHAFIKEVSSHEHRKSV